MSDSHGTSYIQALRNIKTHVMSTKKYSSKRYQVAINKLHGCVEVFDTKLGEVIENRYPRELPPVTSTHGVYKYVGAGKGDYACVTTACEKRVFTDAGHTIKKVTE